MNDIRNLVIIGSGPAAWTAAIYAARGKLNPLLIAGEKNGGQLMDTTLVENFPGFPEGIMGPELMDRMREQAERLGVEIINKNATKLIIDSQPFKVGPRLAKSDLSEQSGSRDLKDSPHPVRTVFLGQTQIQTKSVIIAVGAIANTLKLPGEEKLMGRGIGVCAVCDAPFYKDAERVFVIGGGDSAIEEAMALAKYAKEVIILVRKDRMRATAIMQDHIKQSKNIKVWYKSEAREFGGEKKLERVKIIKNGEETLFPANGLFYAIGHTPAAGWLKGSGVKINAQGYVLIHGGENHTSTNVPGIFAAGDCADAIYRQAIVAAGMGCMAALDAQFYLDRFDRFSLASLSRSGLLRE